MGKEESDNNSKKKREVKKGGGGQNSAAFPALLELPDLPKALAHDLNNFGVAEEASDDETEKLLKGIKKYMKEELKKALEEGREAEGKKECEERLRKSVAVVRALLEARDLTKSPAAVRIFCLLATFLICDDLDPLLRNKMSQVCEKLVSSMRGEGGASLVLSLYLVRRGGAEGKRVWSTLRHTLPRLELSSAPCRALVESLTLLALDGKFLSTKEGRHTVALFLSSDSALVRPLHARILASLLSLPKAAAAHYADVYFDAWNYATDQVKKEIEDHCIQDLMIKVMTLKRVGGNFGKAGQWVFAILSRLHGHRRTYAFSSVITRLYMPVLWRSLRSGHPIERCNSAQVFLDVFPLEKPNAGLAVNAEYKEKQMKEILDLLVDDCHYVRIIAIKGVCKQLRSSMEYWTGGEVRSVMRALADDLANDGSHWSVRAAVWGGLSALLTAEPARLLLGSLLPQLGSHLHDDNPRVRKAFVLLLLALAPHNDVPKYYKVTPVDHLTARLELEGRLVGEPLAKLMLPDIYNKKMPLGKVVGRIKRLVATNSEGAKKLFKYSGKLLDIQDFYTIVIGLLAEIRNRAKEVLETSEADNTENTGQSSDQDRPRKKRKNSAALQDISNENEVDEVCSGGAERTLETRGDSHILLKGLLDCASTLWIMFEGELNKPANEGKRRDLYTMACACIPLFLRAYKGTVMYYATVNFASLIPINKLQPVSTISGACLGELRERLEGAGDSKEIQCLVYSLCAWNRGYEILDLATEWLDPAFRPHNLNLTACQREGKRKTKVRFKSGPGKPLLALRLLGVLFSDIAHEKRLLDKFYDQLYELYLYLDRIKTVIERRVERGSALEEGEVSDVFLCGCLERSLLLGLSLHRPDRPPASGSLLGSASASDLQPLHAAHVSLADISWATSVLVRRLRVTSVESEEEEEEEEGVNVERECVNHVLRTGGLVVALNLTGEEHCHALATFATALLHSEVSGWFVEESVNAVVSLAEHAEAYTERDEWRLFETALPALYQALLDAVAVASHSVQHYFPDVNLLKTGFVILPFTLNRLYGPRNKHYVKAFNILIVTCLKVISRHIRHMDGEIEAMDKLEDHPYFTQLAIKALLSKPSLAKDVLPSLLSQFSANLQDSYMLGACVSMFNTYVRVYGSKESQLEKIVQKAYSLLISHVPSQRKNSDESFFADHDYLDIVKIAQPIFCSLSKHTGCSLSPTTLEE